MGAGHSVGVNTCLKLAEIGTIQGVESLHRHEIFCVTLPISLGLGVLSSCFFDSLTGFFYFFFPGTVLFIWPLGGSGRAPSGDGALIARTPKKTHKRIALTQRPVSCNIGAQPRAHAHTHSKRTSYTALAISISPH